MTDTIIGLLVVTAAGAITYYLIARRRRNRGQHGVGGHKPRPSLRRAGSWWSQHAIED